MDTQGRFFSGQITMGHGNRVIALVFRATFFVTALMLCANADAAPKGKVGKTSDNSERTIVNTSRNDLFKYEEIGDQPRTDLTGMLSRLFWGTTLTLIACCVTLWLAKEFLRRQTVHPQEHEKLKLVAALAVSRRCSLQLIEADGKRIIVALDNGSLRSVVALADSFDSELIETSDQSHSDSIDVEPAEATAERSIPLKAA